MVKFSPQIRFVLAAVVLFAVGQATDRLAQNRRSPRSLPDLTNNVNAIKFSPDGHLLAIARGTRDDNRVELWDTQTGALQRTIRGFDGAVWSVSFSPDSRTLLTGSSGFHQEKVSGKPRARNGRSFAELKWWDAQSGDFKQRFELRDEDLMAVAACYSPDGRFLAAIEYRMEMMMPLGSGSMDPFFPSAISRMLPSMRYDATVKLLDATSGETVFKLKDGFSNYEIPWMMGPGMDLSFMMFGGQRRPPVFSPNGNFVAAWNASEVRLWNSTSGEEVLKLNKFKGRLRAVAFSPDGKLVAAAITRIARKHDQIEIHSEVRLWEVATGTARQVIPLRTETVSSVAFAPNGHQLLIGGWQGREDRNFPSMELIDVDGGSAGSIVSRDEGVASSIEMSPDGELMAFQTGVTTVRVLDTQGWRIRYTFDAGSETGHSDGAAIRRYLVTVKSVPAVAFLSDGITVAGEVEGAGIKLWDARTGEVKKAFAQDAGTGSIADVSADGKIVAEVGDDALRIWNIATGGHTDIPSEKSAVAVALSGDGRTLAVASADEIAIFNDGKTAAKIKSNAAFLSLSGDGKLLATASAGGEIQVWKTVDGALQKHLPGVAGVSALRLSPQNQVLAVGTKDGRVTLWDLQSGAQSLEAKKHSAIVNAIGFSADGKLMATGGDDRSAIIWEVASGKARRTLKGHDFTVTSLAFSPGDNLLAVGSGNASVVLWDVVTGKLNRVMR